MTRWYLLLLFAVISTLVLHASCESFVINNVPLCNPGTQNACTCNTGGSGEQVCHDDGQDYSACSCIDAGVGDTATDAGVTP
jgi:hypothetical protein